MNPRSPRSRFLALSALLLLAAPLGRAGQSAPAPSGLPQHPAFPDGNHAGPNDNPALARMQEQAVKSRNEDRQKRLVQDTARLLELATQLKEEVGKSDQNTLSIQVIKKADEIEKLAKNVKDRMRG